MSNNMNNAQVNSMGIAKPASETRVVVAMSGGVDSSVVAALLHEQGYQVVGITLQLYDEGQVGQKKGTCCAGLDIYDAKRVAQQLNFPHYVLDYQKNFRKDVIDPFVDSYLQGETPIPCVRCNQTVKFRDLFAFAKELGADVMATGHYVKRVDNQGRIELHAGADSSRDQSFFLFATSEEQLEFLRFPLGDYDKTETRQMAEKYGLDVADKPDSQDICFVPNGSYARVVEKLRPGTLEPGNIVDLQGNVLGTHKGIIHYTIGQRRGLELGGLKDPLYVVKLDAENHRVIVGPHEALSCQEITLKDVNWLENPDKIQGEFFAKFRSTQPAIPAIIETAGKAKAKIRFLNPQYGVASGQACVIYQGTRVLGGGWIQRND